MSAFTPSGLAMAYVALLIVGGAGIFILANRSSHRRRLVAQPQPEEVTIPDGLASLIAVGGNEDFRIQGDLHVRADLELPRGLVVEGSLTLDDGVTFNAPVEVIGTVTLGQGSRIGQPLLVHGGITLGRDSRAGPTHVDGDVLLHKGAAVEGPLHCHALYLEGSDQQAPTPEVAQADSLFEGEPPLDTHELASR
ncbi:MAG: hypothetical protein WDA16_06705 [Candidatus Thermoplasmatota archaeon]